MKTDRGHKKNKMFFEDKVQEATQKIEQKYQEIKK